VQSVPITTQVLSLIPVNGEIYSMQHYVIKVVGDLRQVSGFLWILLVFSTNKTDSHDITEILLKVALNTILSTLQNKDKEVFHIRFNVSSTSKLNQERQNCQFLGTCIELV
jgi:hypothetical protein